MDINKGYSSYNFEYSMDLGYLEYSTSKKQQQKNLVPGLQAGGRLGAHCTTAPPFISL